MYKTYFQLSRNPFDLTPDPNSFVPTPRHNEALAALYYCVRQHKGFVVVTGEVGTGKTLLLRCLLRLLRNSKDIVYAYLFNSRLAPMDFLQYVLADFGLPASGKTKADMLLDLSKFLVTRGRQRMTTVLIVDEAHDLPVNTLEELRLLSNLETTEDKLLQIILVGQPELDKKLDSFELQAIEAAGRPAHSAWSFDCRANSGVYRTTFAECRRRSGQRHAIFIAGRGGNLLLFSRASAPHKHPLRKRAPQRLRQGDADGHPAHHRGRSIGVPSGVVLAPRAARTSRARLNMRDSGGEFLAVF